MTELDEAEDLRALEEEQEEEAGLGSVIFWFVMLQFALVGGNMGWKRWETRRRRASGKRRSSNGGIMY